ncbi:hypothetical protein RR11_1559 [Ruegeria sp. R11]|nr:hypothetical protein RR11_1559 [Ruegeria sp. R11]
MDEVAYPRDEDVIEFSNGVEVSSLNARRDQP